MRRLLGWRGRMARFIDAVKRSPVDYRTFDCGPNFAGRHVALMLGVDPAAAYRGAYETELGAIRVMREAGFQNLGDMVSRLLREACGEECEIHPSQARRGDLAGVPQDGAFGIALGIVDGDRVFAPGALMMRHVGLLEATRAWRIGDG
jgi:hypothetical protein